MLGSPCSPCCARGPALRELPECVRIYYEIVNGKNKLSLNQTGQSVLTAPSGQYLRVCRTGYSSTPSELYVGDEWAEYQWCPTGSTYPCSAFITVLISQKQTPFYELSGAVSFSREVLLSVATGAGVAELRQTAYAEYLEYAAKTQPRLAETFWSRVGVRGGGSIGNTFAVAASACGTTVQTSTPQQEQSAYITGSNCGPFAVVATNQSGNVDLSLRISGVYDDGLNDLLFLPIGSLSVVDFFD